MRKLRIAFLALVVTGLAGASQPSADDSVRNARDPHPDASLARPSEADRLTATDQSNARSDVEITALIRRAVVANDSLSTNARNVKIITREGRVLLKGPVASRHEKRLIGTIARQVAGAKRVTNRLDVLGAE